MRKKLSTAAIGFGAHLSMAAPAMAADMAVKAPPPAPVVAVYNWSGFLHRRQRRLGAEPRLRRLGNARWERSQVVAPIAPEASPVDRSGIAGKPISSCSAWKLRAIGPRSRTRASA